MKCPKCNGIIDFEHLILSKLSDGKITSICNLCDNIITIEQEMFKILKNNLNEINDNNLNIDDKVIIINENHKYFLEHATIIGKSYVHYRINIKINGKNRKHINMWVPHHWVCKTPKELL